MVPPNKQLAHYIAAQLDALDGLKTQRDVARELGYDKPNIISMFKRGEAKVPLAKVYRLARALNGDPKHVWRLALQQLDDPSIGEAVTRIFGGDPVTENETELIELLRRVSDGLDPKLSPEQKALIEEILLGIAGRSASDFEGLGGRADAGGLQDLNFKVDPSFHRLFKTTAAQNGMSMKELLEDAFRLWTGARSRD